MKPQPPRLAHNQRQCEFKALDRRPRPKEVGWQFQNCTRYLAVDVKHEPVSRWRLHVIDDLAVELNEA